MRVSEPRSSVGGFRPSAPRTAGPVVFDRDAHADDAVVLRGWQARAIASLLEMSERPAGPTAEALELLRPKVGR